MKWAGRSRRSREWSWKSRDNDWIGEEKMLFRKFAIDRHGVLAILATSHPASNQLWSISKFYASIGDFFIFIFIVQKINALFLLNKFNKNTPRFTLRNVQLYKIRVSFWNLAIFLINK